MNGQKPRRRRPFPWESVLAALFVLTTLAALLGLFWWLRTDAPCELFSVSTAPVRCLPGGEG